MIPKKIHYCWFGPKTMPKETTDIINSWKEKLLDYEFILWNEENFNIDSHHYVKEAYKSKKYAFVSDYVRIYALYHHGGIYLDTDVEVIKPFDDFLNDAFFIGCEKVDVIQTGVIGSTAKHDLLNKILNYYNNKSFIKKDGKLNLIPNPQIITPIIIKEYGWIPNKKIQKLDDGISIYPIDYFCAKDWKTGKINITKNTYTLHHFSGTWHTNTDKLKSKIETLIGSKATQYVVNFKKRFFYN